MTASSMRAPRVSCGEHRVRFARRGVRVAGVKTKVARTRRLSILDRMVEPLISKRRSKHAKQAREEGTAHEESLLQPVRRSWTRRAHPRVRGGAAPRARLRRPRQRRRSRRHRLERQCQHAPAARPHGGNRARTRVQLVRSLPAEPRIGSQRACGPPRLLRPAHGGSGRGEPLDQRQRPVPLRRLLVVWRAVVARVEPAGHGPCHRRSQQPRPGRAPSGMVRVQRRGRQRRRQPVGGRRHVPQHHRPIRLRRGRGSKPVRRHAHALVWRRGRAEGPVHQRCQHGRTGRRPAHPVRRARAERHVSSRAQHVHLAGARRRVAHLGAPSRSQRRRRHQDVPHGKRRRGRVVLRRQRDHE